MRTWSRERGKIEGPAVWRTLRPLVALEFSLRVGLRTPFQERTYRGSSFVDAVSDAAGATGLQTAPGLLLPGVAGATTVLVAGALR